MYCLVSVDCNSMTTSDWKVLRSAVYPVGLSGSEEDESVGRKCEEDAGTDCEVKGSLIAKGNKPKQNQIYEILSIPSSKISKCSNHKRCNLWRSSRIHILGHLNL